jgi:hypothetical protein
MGDIIVHGGHTGVFTPEILGTAWFSTLHITRAGLNDIFKVASYGYNGLHRIDGVSSTLSSSGMRVGGVVFARRHWGAHESFLDS